ncbi:casein kinase I isoform delta, partial [Lineolata rhizophorae]
VAGKWRLIEKISNGGFGVVYRAVNVFDNTIYAVKVERELMQKDSALRNELRVYNNILRSDPNSSGTGIARIFHYGHVDKDYRALVMQRLGPSLEDLFQYCGRSFSLKTVLMLGEQMIQRLEYLHVRNIIHQDIKPENFMMGLANGVDGAIVYIADFGLSKDFESTPPFPHKSTAPQLPQGTTRYCSVKAHRGHLQSYRDDLECLGYVLIYFLRGGRLPWCGLRNGRPTMTDEEHARAVMQIKMSISVQKLCEGLPEEFARYFEHICALRYGEVPRYAYLRGLFWELYRSRGYAQDNVYDWSI